ncbi:MAG: HAD family hydrolase [Sedimentisphaerales bacterium]|nr:HAD family hydrolase [Sedimentisphaerales bacterium]
MQEQRVREILEKIQRVQVAVYGDFCLDAYWMLDPAGSEVSVETGLQGQAVRRHYYTLGGASNVVANLAALRPAGIRVIGVIGDDIFGRELVRQFHELGVDTRWLLVQDQQFDTVTFGKRYQENQELPRIDFGFFNARSETTDDRLLDYLEKALETADGIILNQQVPGSIPHPAFIEQLNERLARHPDRIVLLDSRHYGERFRGVCRKTNAIEAARLNRRDAQSDDVIAVAELKQYAEALYARDQRPVFITRGARGILAADAGGVKEIPGIQFHKKLDPVGAGDTTVSALLVCLAAGVKPAEAAEFANFAAAVTVQKLYQTGTATAPEILAVARDSHYIYQPELAEDIRQARTLEATEIEICCDRSFLADRRIRHAVFDHDGTISTLRQGWEAVMAPVMIRAILGDRYDSADETLYHKVRSRVQEYIDQSTGIQTIVQMEALVEMVREFALVPAEQIQDRFGYKQIYNDALMRMVNRRLEKFRRGALDLYDYTIKGAVRFLHRLREKGVTLYLASGTDREDVLNEARVLGYADLFGDNIYGAVGDVSRYSKKMVLETILQANRLTGRALAVFGDGPVEIRECRKRDGLAVGIASDEIRRHGLCPEKRTRLIKAGAHVMICDFSEPEPLLALLFPTGS